MGKVLEEFYYDVIDTEQPDEHIYKCYAYVDSTDEDGYGIEIGNDESSHTLATFGYDEYSRLMAESLLEAIKAEVGAFGDKPIPGDHRFEFESLNSPLYANGYDNIFKENLKVLNYITKYTGQ